MEKVFQNEAVYYQAENATVKGNVCFEQDANIWYQTVIRTETAPVRIGRRTNIQDGCVIHTDTGYPVSIGNDVTIGHGAIVHGAVIEDEVLIGMGAILLNGCRIGKHCLVAAGSLVLENRTFDEGSLIAGSPAKVLRSLTPDEITGIQEDASHYVEKASEQLPALKIGHSCLTEETV